MYDWSTISYLELELSNHCNSFCPQCARYHADGKVKKFPLKHLDYTLVEKNMLNQLPNLKNIDFCGGFGDPLMHPELDLFIDYFLQTNINITIWTNASLRNNEWWEKLATKNVTVVFCLDGLEDTHSLYRINTSYNKIISNAKSFISQGGTAHCQTIIFKHNEHQIEDIKKTVNSLGFAKHKIIKSDRFYDLSQMPVYIKGKYSHTLEPPVYDYKDIKKNTFSSKKELKAFYLETQKNFSCPWFDNAKLYIDCNGLVFPCCFIGTLYKGSFDDEMFKVLVTQKQNIDLNRKSFKDILQSKIYDDYMTNKIKKTAHPICIENCISIGRRT